MRHVVKKPTHSKQQLKAQGSTDQLAVKPMAEVIVPSSAKSLDPKRLKQATKVKQSHLISHFSNITSDLNKQALAPKPDLPTALMAPQTTPAESDKPAKPKTTAQLLEHAIKQAKSHEHASVAPAKHRKKTTRKLVASGVAVLLLTFVGYQELPNMRLQIASAKAGFSASLPDYQPAGYSLGQLQYSPGVVASKFESNSDDRTYTLTQKASSWDSRALRDNYIRPMTDDYQTVESGGQTIYVYNNNATWVSGGIWYVVQTDGSLSNRQLVELATSI